MTAPLLVLDKVSKTFARGGQTLAAVRDASLTLQPGETLGLVGPSGSGKTTLSRLVMRLTAPDSGAIAFAGTDLLAQRGAALRRLRGQFQMVFQDPLAAFNPRATVGGALADPLRIHAVAPARERPARVARLLERVGLDPALARRAIHEISGGQRQRVAIARAIATDPKLIVLDEAVSALDVSVRGKILELLVTLQRESGVSYLFVSHDLAVVRVLAHRIAIMDQGRIVETGAARDIVAHPQSGTGQALVAAVPRLLEPSS
jgi:peptide/nickel transport system ATP-binding protein